MEMKLYSIDKTQSIDFDIPEEYKKVAVNCSGGADSAILLLLTIDFLMKNNRDDTTVSVLTCGNDFKDRWNPRKAADVINFVIEHTGFKNFDMHYSYYRDIQDDKYFHEIEDALFADERIDLLLSGITSNPLSSDTSVENASGVTINLMDDALDIRNVQNKKTPKAMRIRNRGTMQAFYMPFQNVDKKLVAGIYDLYGVTDTLLPLTRSCEAVPDPDKTFDPDFEKTPCGDCWWCLERKWAFGTF